MNLNEPLVLGPRTTSLCLHQTEQNVLFGRVDKACATRGRVFRAHKSGIGGAAREQEAVDKQPRNFDSGQIRDVDERAGIIL